MADLELAYLAGLFDGEGCIALHRQKQGNIYSYVPYISVSMCDPQGVTLFQARYGGRLAKEFRGGARGNPKHRSIYRWALRGKACIPLVNEFVRLSRVKTRQFETMRDYLLQFPGDRTKTKFTDAEKATQQEAYETLKALKRIKYDD